MKSPFTTEQEQKLSDFTSCLYDVTIWRSLGKLGGNSPPEDLIFPDLCDAYADLELSSVECIYIAGNRILEA